MQFMRWPAFVDRQNGAAYMQLMQWPAFVNHSCSHQDEFSRGVLVTKAYDLWVRCRCLSICWKLLQRVVREGSVTSFARSRAGLQPSAWLSVWPMKGETQLLALQVSNDSFAGPCFWCACCFAACCTVLQWCGRSLLSRVVSSAEWLLQQASPLSQPMILLLLLTMSLPTSNHSI